MRPLSEEARRLIVELERSRSAPSRRRLVDHVGRTGDVLAVPHLLPFLLRPETHFEAAAVVSALLETASGKEILFLSRTRGWRSLAGLEEPHTEWAYMRPEQVGELEYEAGWSVWLLGLASFHGSGYVREAAVQRLAGRPERHALPFLLLRANDWVPQVRERARRALDLKLAAGPVGHFAAALPFLRELERGRREDHRPFVRQVHEALLGEPGQTGLRAAAGAKDRSVRRLAFDLLWSLPDEELPPLLDAALSDSDLPIRLGAARRALRLPSWRTWSGRLRADPAAAVRATLLDRLGALEPAPREELELFLTDRSASVRRDARFFLARSGRSDFAPTYRAALASPHRRHLEVAILGLGETGDASDRSLILPYLAAETARLRRAALVALTRLDEGLDTDLLLRALGDPAASVSRTAREAVLRGRRLLPLDALAPLLGSGHPAHVRRNALRLLLARAPWSSLPHLLDAIGDSDAASREVALGGLDRWLELSRRNFVQPSPDEVERVRLAVERSAEALGDRRQALERLLRERRLA